MTTGTILATVGGLAALVSIIVLLIALAHH